VRLGRRPPVLALPGFFATDADTAVLRAFLHWRGYHTEGWHAGLNGARWDALETAVLPAIRLAQPEDGWQPFRRAPWLRPLYPRGEEAAA
jgi:hypothetical protein